MKNKLQGSAVVWWFHPAIVLVTLNLVLVLAALVTPEHFYEMWRTSKFFGPYHAWLIAGALLVFSAAFAIGKRVSVSSRLEIDRGAMISIFRATCLLAVAAYGLWILIALSNGMSLAMIKDVVVGTRGATRQLKNVFQTIPGITTLTQVGIFSCALFPLMHRRTRIDWLLVGTLVSLALARAVFISERLAFIELIIPLGFLATFRYVHRATWMSHRMKSIGMPVFALVALVGFFAASESFRSWQIYKDSFDSYPEFVTWRLSSYYLAALNNGAIWVNQQHVLPAPHFSMQWVWDFPLVKLLGISYTDLFGADPTELKEAYLRQYATPELNNPSGNLSQFLDFGLAGYFVYWALLGAFLGCAFRSFLNNQVFGLIVIPMAMIGILETPRIPYFTSTRFFPALAMLALVCLVFGRLARHRSNSSVSYSTRTQQQLV